MTLLDLVSIQVGEEAVFGTEVAAYSEWPGKPTSVKLILNSQEILASDIGSLNEAVEAYHGVEEFGWEIEFRIQSLKFLYWVMGTLSSETGTNPYTHNLALVSGVLKSLSVEIVMGNGDFSFKFLGSKIEEMTLTFVKNEVPMCRLKAKAKDGSIDTTPGSPSQLSTTPFDVADTSTLNINSVGYPSVCERAEYQFKQDLNWDYGLDGQAPAEVNEGGKRGMVASYDIRISDETLWNLRENFTDFPLSHVIQRGGSASDQLTITVPNAKTFKPDYPGPGGGQALRIKLPCRVIDSFTMVAIDATASYSDPQ